MGEEAVVPNPKTGALHYLNPPAALTRRWRDPSLKLYINELVEKGLLING